MIISYFVAQVAPVPDVIDAAWVIGGCLTIIGALVTGVITLWKANTKLQKRLDTVQTEINSSQAEVIGANMELVRQYAADRKSVMDGVHRVELLVAGITSKQPEK